MKAKWVQTLFKVFALFGMVVMGAILLRSQKSAKESGTSFTDVVQDDLKNTTRFSVFLALLCSVIGALLFMQSTPAGAVAMALIWGAIPASSSATFNITYVPQFMGFTVASAPTAFQINVLGDGMIFNLDANGCSSMRNIRIVGAGATTYIFQLANGLINGKNGTVTITNSAAAQLDIYAWSKENGNAYMTYMSQQALANSGVNLRKFAFAAFPSAATGDTFSLYYNDGSQQIAKREDLNFALGYTQSLVTSQYSIDNIAPALIDTVTFTPVLSQQCYVMQYQPAAGVVNSAVVAKG